MTVRDFLKRVNAKTIDYPARIEAYAHDDRVLNRALGIIPFLYFFLLFESFRIAANWKLASPLSESRFHPIWTIGWASYVSFDHVVALICGLFLVGMLIGSLFYMHRAARVIAFLALFEYHAFMSSFGAPEHNIVSFIYPLLFCIFLPDVWEKKETTFLERKTFLIGFIGIQTYLGLIYSLAGIGKVVRGIEQLISGQANFLSPDAFALHIAYWLPATGSDSLFGPYIVAHPLAGWPLFLGTLYFQVFTLWAIFKPSLHWIWGVFLVSFYILNFLIMNIFFVDVFFLIAALFLYSPFDAVQIRWKDRLADLPLFGPLFRLIK